MFMCLRRTSSTVVMLLLVGSACSSPTRPDKNAVLEVLRSIPEVPHPLMTSENSGNFYFQFVSSNLDSIELIRARPIAWIDTLILNGIQPVENESQSFWRYLITATTDTFDLTLSESDTLRWVMDWYGEQRGAKGRLRWTGWVVPGENAILVDPIGPFYLTYTPAEYGTRIYMDYWPHEYWVTRSSNGTTIFVMERQGSTEIYGSSAESVGHDGLR